MDTIDVTGFPEPVVQRIEALVETLRQSQAKEGESSVRTAA